MSQVGVAIWEFQYNNFREILTTRGTAVSTQKEFIKQGLN